jgi:hypothetical protein
MSLKLVDSTKDQKEQDAWNDDNSLMRFEFVEAIIRISIVKYYAQYRDASDSIRKLVTENITPNLKDGAKMNRNVFRSEWLYTQEVDNVLRQHRLLLFGVYSKWASNRPGMKGRGMSQKEWLNGIDHKLHLTDSVFNKREAHLAFAYARMGVSDEFSVPHELITFVDFLEALVRVAVTKELPTKADFERMQEVVLQIGGKCENWVDFFELAKNGKYREQLGAKTFGPQGYHYLGMMRSPLHERLSVLLELVETIIYGNWPSMDVNALKQSIMNISFSS